MDIENSEINANQPSSKEKVTQNLTDAQKYVAFRMAQLSKNNSSANKYQSELEPLNERLKKDKKFRDDVVEEISNVVKRTGSVKLSSGRELNGLTAKVVRTLSLSGENLPLTSFEAGNIIYGDTSDKVRTQQRVGNVFRRIRETLKDSNLKLFKVKNKDGRSPG